MSTRLLPVILGNTEYELSQTIPRVPPGRAPRRYMEFISRSYRRRAIAWLLLTGKAEPFARNLQRSATAWLAYLRDAPAAEKACSQLQPLFGALACGDLEIAVELARSAHFEWNREAEYEDDFLYAAFLQRSFLLEAASEEPLRWLSRLEAWLQGEESAQLALGRALLARDSAAFQVALERRIAARREWLAQAAERGAIDDEEQATEAHVFLEGLALLRIAEGRGIEVADELPLVPSLARVAAFRAGSESWRDFDGD